jgi:hypothetical protein
MDWYRLTLNSAQVAAGKVQEYKEAFETAFTAARGPRIMALFRRDCDDGGVDLYFTPESGKHAAELLAGWGCVPCSTPPLLGLQLLVGHNEITYYLT